MKRMVVKKEMGRYVSRVRRGQKRRAERKWIGWLCGATCMLAAVLILDFSLFSGFQTGIAEDGVKKEAVQAEQTLQEAQNNGAQAEIEKQAPVLLDEAPEGQLCIGILPTETGGYMRYYVPDAAVQKELYDRISGMDVIKLDELKLPPDWVIDAWDYNIKVKYGEYSLDLCEGGVMRIDRMSRDYTDFDEWAVRDEEVAEFILGIVENDLGMNLFDTGSIRDIVRAELKTGPAYESVPKDSILLTDPEKLASLEMLLSDAEKSFWSKCPFGNCQLVLTTAAGEEIVLAMACDSCTAFYVNGCFYDYMPVEYRNSDGDHPHNDILYDLFGITPEYFFNT